jgi:hypothetical protein
VLSYFIGFDERRGDLLLMMNVAALRLTVLRMNLLSEQCALYIAMYLVAMHNL